MSDSFKCRTCGTERIVSEVYITALEKKLSKAEDMLRHYLKCGYLPHISQAEAEAWLSKQI